jgi:hypothetical protein
MQSINVGEKHELRAMSHRAMQLCKSLALRLSCLLVPFVLAGCPSSSCDCGAALRNLKVYFDDQQEAIEASGYIRENQPSVGKYQLYLEISTPRSPLGRPMACLETLEPEELSALQAAKQVEKQFESSCFKKVPRSIALVFQGAAPRLRVEFEDQASFPRVVEVEGRFAISCLSIEGPLNDRCNEPAPKSNCCG